MSSQANTSENQDKVIIGARALGDQIYKIMPTYDLLLEQLNEISLSAVKQLDSQIFFSSEKIGGNCSKQQEQMSRDKNIVPFNVANIAAFLF
ncbi:hypothetical protein [Paenibacillus sp. FSL K6-2862]|uniref:hypothetical protein n=1 Tax=Paenibacillus sp. FSL K6-2862 TaxID=2921484 RepID=UPI0030F681AF